MSKYNSPIYYAHTHTHIYPLTPSIVLKNLGSKLLVIVFSMMQYVYSREEAYLDALIFLYHKGYILNKYYLGKSSWI